MKNLLIIGASGFGRDIYDFAKESVGYGIEFHIKGFLDCNIDALKEYPLYPAVISSEDDYEIQEDDVFICALGDVRIKKKCTEKMLSRGAEFYTLIHYSAHISPSAKVGKGCFIGYNVAVGSYSVIEDHVLVQNFSIIGHDAKIGKYSRLDSKVVCVGGVIVKEMVCIYTSAVINHNVILMNGCTIGALSFVINTVKENFTVFGNPARVLKEN